MGRLEQVVWQRDDGFAGDSPLVLASEGRKKNGTKVLVGLLLRIPLTDGQIPLHFLPKISNTAKEPQVNVILTCKEFGITLTVPVSDLAHEPSTNTFTMPLCIGDDWYQKVRSDLGIVPVEVVFEKGVCRIHLKTYAEVTKLGGWLIEANQQSQEGYRTMRG